MKLNGVTAGDIVRVDGSLAFVIEVEPHKLVVSWLRQPATRRTVSAQTVEAHWKKKA